MYRVFVLLQVKDFQALELFERKASRIMLDYDGRIADAFETIRNEGGSGEEIHLLEFPNEQNFLDYSEDSRHQTLKQLREDAISATVVKVNLRDKSYE
jgi:uncharacterized protein (DUF1330 family)